MSVDIGNIINHESMQIKNHLYDTCWIFIIYNM